VIRSVLAHDYVRNPYVQNDTSTVFANNIIFDWVHENGIDLEVHNSLPGTDILFDAVGNRFIRGPNTTNGGQAYMFYYSDDVGTSSRIYRSDNTLTNDDGTIIEEWNRMGYNPNTGTPPVAYPTNFRGDCLEYARNGPSARRRRAADGPGYDRHSTNCGNLGADGRHSNTQDDVAAGKASRSTRVR